MFGVSRFRRFGRSYGSGAQGSGTEVQRFSWRVKGYDGSMRLRRLRVCQTRANGIWLGRELRDPVPEGPKYLYGTRYGFCSSNFPYGLGKYTPYGIPHMGT